MGVSFLFRTCFCGFKGKQKNTEAILEFRSLNIGNTPIGAKDSNQCRATWLKQWQHDVEAGPPPIGVGGFSGHRFVFLGFTTAFVELSS